jgi:hypothetical protein
MRFGLLCEYKLFKVVENWVPIPSTPSTVALFLSLYGSSKLVVKLRWQLTDTIVSDKITDCSRLWQACYTPYS